MNSDRRPLVVGNWKMHGSVAFARELAHAVASGAAKVSAVDIVICPPHLLLRAAAAELAGGDVGLGAQTVSEFRHGAYTGETSAAMLAEAGCRFVIVGHSERRHLFGDSNTAVAAKAIAVTDAGLVPIICVGETHDERHRGATNAVIAAQLSAVMEAEGGPAVFNNAVIAYEPVWAIGTGETATPAQAEAVHEFIRSTIAATDPVVAEATRILYGGSVKPDNAADLFRMMNIDGGLIGGASLNAEDFLRICVSVPRA
ncbi:MAG: triose-phosphate isomerase [Proteobacteria bacterium]|nr:MAG: triose-phosphate isomerase [Pseudomonadota bacterium]TDJ68546.1 MAG: triose-phosphate isomerase [Pseudomonadota bacterium]